jgi:hypothetical protein
MGSRIDNVRVAGWRILVKAEVKDGGVVVGKGEGVRLMVKGSTQIVICQYLILW